MPTIPRPESLSAVIADFRRRLRMVETTQTRGPLSVTRATTVPADGTLEAGEAAIWLDDTVGATRLMVKAKDSAGTVVTGSVVLT